jgi:alanine racemase
MSRTSRVRLEVSLPILRENCGKIRAAVAPAHVTAVLKADAYGLGIEPIAQAVAGAGASGFAVAELNEAISLTRFGLPVQILGSVLPEEIPDALVAGIVLPVDDVRTAALISQEACRQRRVAVGHIVVDTGMGRLGILAEHARDAVRQIVQLPFLRCEGIYSHFPMAYRRADEVTRRQIDAFLRLLRDLEDDGVTFEKRHMANSDAINNFPEAFAPPLNVVRTGINLYGSFDIEGRRALDLEPVLTLKTRLTAVRRLPAGMTISYGRTYTLPHDTLVGTISAGYADGIPFAMSNRGYVLVRGKACPVLGRVCMDYTTVSLEQVPDAQCGDEVICLGGEGPLAISVEQWANLKGTHPYDVICSFGKRVERRYVE